jgi:hypothetical protein
MGVMGLDALIDAQFYMRSRRQCDDLLYKKKMSFCFNHPHNPNARSMTKKFGSLKDFEVHGIHKKEPWDKQIRSINPIGMVM